ncbi:MAG: EexN family lipoprotein [Legionellales bacterium]|nr:EexN family lipoprotein [Legionellales bacterium]
MIKKMSVALCVSMLLCSCSKEVVHDVAWWKSHDAERKAMIKRCENDPGELKNNPNCDNAASALTQKMFDPNNDNSPHLPN